MKRLKYLLLSMEPNTATYTEMYNGKMLIDDGTAREPYEDNSEIYYYDDIGFEISYTNKLLKDRPTVKIAIPAERLGIDIFISDSEEPKKEFLQYADSAADFCLRSFKKYLNELNENLYNRSRPVEESGKYFAAETGGKILKRNGAYFSERPQKDYINGSGIYVHLLNDGINRPPKMCLCFTIQVQLPKRKLRKAIQMLCKDLPEATLRFINDFDFVGLNKALRLAEQQNSIRQWLKNSEYCAFIANGSILPRAKGTELPLKNAIPFKSTPNDEIEIYGIKGMGFKKGVTVITGGGYSGKSTLLDAISAGIYNHCIGDGRELCITDETAMMIAAEDGRCAKNLNISPFIKWIPNGDTKDFSTDHASGSTSQASNIMEAIDMNVKLLLIDEDKSATNFMIRDKKMKELIAKEPITPFTDRVNELYEKLGISTILVIGGSGEYLSVSHKVYMMEDYLINDVSEKAFSIGKCSFNLKPEECVYEQKRLLISNGFNSYPEESWTERLEISDMGFIIIGDERIDIRGLYNLYSHEQTEALGFMLRFIEAANSDSIINIKEKVNELYYRIQQEGLDYVYTSFFTTCNRFLALPRKQELFALINRMRKTNYTIK